MPSCSPVYPSFTLVVTEKLWRSGRVCHSRATYGRRPAFDIDTSVDALMTTMDDRWEARGPGPFLSTIAETRVTQHIEDEGTSMTNNEMFGEPIGEAQRTVSGLLRTLRNRALRLLTALDRRRMITSRA